MTFIPLGQGQSKSNKVFSCIWIFSQTARCSNFKLCTWLGDMKMRVPGNISCDLDPKVKVNSQIMYFFVNTSPPSSFKLFIWLDHMMKRVLGNILWPWGQGQRSNNVFFFLNFRTLQLKTLQVIRSHNVEGAGQYLVCYLWGLMPRSRNVFSFKCISLTVWCSHFKLPRFVGHMMWRVLSNILCNHDPKVRVKSEKAGICDCVPSTAL